MRELDAVSYAKARRNSSQLAEKANKQQEEWITPTLINGWYVTTNSSVGYMKDEFGFVHVRGKVFGGTTGTTVFTLPVGYRPPISTSFFVPTNSTSQIVFAVIKTTGEVELWFSAATTYIDLSAVCFKIN